MGGGTSKGLSTATKATKVLNSSVKAVAKSVGKTIGGCNCFTAGTKVLTDEGEKNIEDIEVGDMVLSKDENTGEVGYKEVTATFNHETGTDEVYKIHVGDQVIEATFNHPFWVDGQGWTFVKDLEVGDLLVQSDGNKLKIESIELEHEQATVYNMTVDEFHTYFVSDLGIWVHNTGACDFVKTKSYTLQDGMKLKTDNVLSAAEEFLEKGYKDVGNGRFMSADGTRVVRMGDTDILGKHGGGPHMNFENLAPNPNKSGKMMVVQNLHIYLEG